MNVLLISQCEKRALTETRRILDQFAERRGDRTWQTPITADGLNTLRRLLKKSARRNTAVACHWIRGHDHSELIWIVGDSGRFNAQGAVPTNTTERDILRRNDENDWHTAEIIRLLAAMAALFHDFGKASVLFQNKLKSGTRAPDPYRHEWVSLRMFQAFVGADDDRGWLNRLSSLADLSDSSWVQRLQKDPDQIAGTAPLSKLQPLARIVGWLIVSHHRLPTPPEGCVNEKMLTRLFEVIDSNWCGSQADSTAGDIKNCWTFKSGTPDISTTWRARASKLATRMLTEPGLIDADWLANPYVAHLGRLALMLADHHYSSGPGKPELGDATYKAYANTDNDGKLKQRLDEHLIGVEKNAHRIVRSLPKLATALPRIARHNGFKRRTTDKRFRWQDKAFDLAVSLQHRSTQHGFFGVNMASTGCGKTLANGRIMYGLSDAQRGARFCIAMGLRTLTLQTGKAYRVRLGLGEDDLAVMVGGDAVRQLFVHYEAKRKQDQRAAESTTASRGSASAAALLPDNTYVHYEGSLDAGPLGNL